MAEIELNVINNQSRVIEKDTKHRANEGRYGGVES
jgi:hypothetical protein